jgi:hydrogenase expression/formation protein HypC
MCLAIPAQVKSIDEDNLATVDILGVTREVALDLTPSAEVGSYVLIHAGFAIEVVSEEAAQETLDLIKEFPELADLDVAS